MAYLSQMAAVRFLAALTKTGGFQMTIEIQLLSKIIRVRVVPSTKNDVVRLWDDLLPGQVHALTRLTYEQLRERGTGYHDIQ